MINMKIKVILKETIKGVGKIFGWKGNCIKSEGRGK